MSLKRYDAKRDKNEPEIVLALRQLGASVVLLSEKDIPDLLVGHQNQTYLLEVKTEDGRLTAGQREWHNNFWQGKKPIVVRSVKDAIETINQIKPVSSRSPFLSRCREWEHS